MRRVVGVAGVCLLVVMLAATTPFGADDAAHRDVLLHPLFPHLHVDDEGRLVIHAEHAAKSSQPPLRARQPGPTLGASTGADEAAAGLALTPPLPSAGAWWSLWATGQRLRDENEPLPSGRAEAPPHPPPTRTTS